MRTPCKNPCVECPFRVGSLPGWLGGFSIAQTMEAAHSESDFDCHMTRNKKTRKECAGRLLYAKNSAKMFRRKDLHDAQKEVIEANPDYQQTVLSWVSFSRHHDADKFYSKDHPVIKLRK